MGTRLLRQPSGPDDFRLYYVCLGAISMAAQFAILREAAVTGKGNEACYALAMGLWLIGGALGSWVVGALGRRRPASLSKLALIPALAAVGVLLMRGLPLGTGFQGLTPAYGQLFLILVAGVLPASLASGWLFVSGLGRGKPDATEAYYLELFGLAAGGIMSYVVAARVSVTALLMALMAAAFIVTASARWGIRGNYRNLVLAALLVGLVAAAAPIEKATTAWAFPGQRVILVEETPRNRVVLTELDSQQNLYLSGSLAGSTSDYRRSEDLVHLALTARDGLKRVFIVGGGPEGAVSETLRHPVDSVEYAEADADLARILKERLPMLSLSFNDPRVALVRSDARSMLASSDASYDAILLMPPAPSNLNFNRFYTKEFFALASARLAPGGVLAISVDYPEESPSDLDKSFLGSLVASIKPSLPNLSLMPDQDLVVLASPEPISGDIGAAAARFSEMKGAAGRFNEAYLKYRLSRAYAPGADLTGTAAASANTDLKPTLVGVETLRRLAWTDYGLARALQKAASIMSRLGWLAAFAVVVMLLLALRAAGDSRRGLALNAASVHFCSFFFEILLIYLCQVRFGDAYGQMAIIAGLVMLGLAAGAKWGGGLAAKPRGPAIPAALLTAYALLIPLLLLPQLAARPIFWVFAAALGAVSGLAYPVFMSVAQAARFGEVASHEIYGAELAGASIAAFSAFFIVPIMGIKAAMVVLAAIAATMVAVRSRFLRRER